MFNVNFVLSITCASGGGWIMLRIFYQYLTSLLGKYSLESKTLCKYLSNDNMNTYKKGNNAGLLFRYWIKCGNKEVRVNKATHYSTFVKCQIQKKNANKRCWNLTSKMSFIVIGSIAVYNDIFRRHFVCTWV